MTMHIALLTALLAVPASGPAAPAPKPPAQPRFSAEASQWAAKKRSAKPTELREEELISVARGFDNPRVGLSLVTLDGVAPVAPECGDSSSELVLYVLSGAVKVGEGEAAAVVNAGGVARVDGGFTPMKRTSKKTAEVLALRVPFAEQKWHPATGKECEGVERTKVDSPVFVAAGEAAKYAVAGGKGSVQMLLEGPRARLTYAGLLHAERGMAVPEHNHGAETEVLFILRGAGEMTVGAEKSVVRRGTAVQIPPATQHSFANTGRERLEAIQFYAPPGPEQRFKKAPSPAPVRGPAQVAPKVP